MHILTKIEQEIKNNNRVNLYINDNYFFSCDMEIVLKYKLKEGMKIDKNNLLELVEKDSEKRGFQLGVYYLSHKPRTVHEVSKYLEGKGYKNSIINKVLEKLLYYKYIDDGQYTKNYILSCIKTKKKSSEMMRLELINKGIPLEIIDEYSYMFSQEVNLQIAREISVKYFYQKSDLPFKQLKDKLSQLLVRKGFTWDVIGNCLSFLEEDEDIQSTLNSNKNNYISQATKLAERYFLKYSKNEKNRYLLQQKIKQALYRKGHDMDTIHFVVDDLLNKDQ